MVLFIDTISKITVGKGVNRVYKNVDNSLLESLLGLRTLVQSKPARTISSAGKISFRDSEVSVEKFLTAYKAYCCGIISKEQMSKIKKGYYESRIKNC